MPVYNSSFWINLPIWFTVQSLIFFSIFEKKKREGRIYKVNITNLNAGFKVVDDEGGGDYKASEKME